MAYRPTLMGTRGMIATEHYLSAEAGMRMLHAGGNAFDAAVAATLAEHSGPTAPAEVERSGDREIEVTIREGRKRQVRRMAEAVGNEAEALRRVRIGSLGLGKLREGEARHLETEEVAALWEDSAP